MTFTAQYDNPIRRATVFAGDLLGAVAVIFCIPLAILAIGIPITFVMRLLLWLTGQL